MSFPLATRRPTELHNRDELYSLNASSIDLKRSMLSVLWRRRYMFLVLLVPIFLGLLTAFLWLPKNYVATSLLAYDIRPMRTVVSAVSQHNTAEDVSVRVEPSVLSTEAEIITSRATIIRMLADHPELAHPPTSYESESRETGWVMKFRQWIEPVLPNSKPPLNAAAEEIITRISRRLSASVLRSSSLIQVSFQAGNADYTARVANAIVSAYLHDQVQAKRTAIAGTIKQLQARLVELGQQVVRANQGVQDFRGQHGLLKTTNGTPPNMQQLADISINEARVRADLTAKESLLASLKAMSPEAVVALQSESGAGAPLTHSLVQLQGAIQKKLSDNEGKWSHSSAEYTLLAGQLQAVQKFLADQGRLIVQHEDAEARALRNRLTELQRARVFASVDIQRENALDSQLLRLTAEAESAKASYDTFLTGFTRMSMMENAQVPDVRVVDPASAPIHPAISTMIITILLVPVSALLSGVIVVIRQYAKSGMGLTDREFERTFGLSVFGVTPNVPKRRKTDFYRWASEHARQASCTDEALAAYADGVRGIRNMVDLHLDSQQSQFVAIVSAVSGEGKSALAISLAAAWAASGVSTLLIDCDFQKPTLHSVSGGENGVGLTTYLQGKADISEVVQSVSKNFDLLPAGEPVRQAFYDFGETQLRALLGTFGDRYGRILLDLPPILTGSDAVMGAATTNLTLFVSRWDRTPKSLTEGALERLRTLNVKRVAAVLTQVNMKKYYSELGVSSYVYTTRL